MSRFIAAAFLLVATAAFAAANQVAVPVMTGTINGATYRTTVDIRSGSSTGCTFELRRSDGATFRSTDHVDAGTPKLFEAFASEFQPLATIVRVSCTDAAEVYSRIHESADGGITFNDGPLYRAADVLRSPLARRSRHQSPATSSSRRCPARRFASLRS